ncbi:RAMP superfamily CRISPR-associated protein [Rubinisphaera italica]|uniref:RAMP superfamily protein n=1 Tax=Rubinisphaera italica TaxID=2527969 RepID=A0A5C5XLZ1_9PLAN|nr:RAMP superfamily CRISPR-associated protein [Rubinisphaera italica]TWT63728.1 RAMP superfamily protein [Rubinisphaera italica]
MARKLLGRLQIHGTLEAIDPLHTGCGEADYLTDQALATDGQGNLYLPGTSLAGALKNWCRNACGENLVNSPSSPWGYHSNNDQGNEVGHASYIFVENMIITMPDGVPFEIRDHVGIDDHYGTAADQIKFDRAVIPKGSLLKLELVVDLNGDDSISVNDNQTKSLIGYLLEYLQKHGIRLGGGKSRGLGRVKLKDEITISEELYTFEGVLAKLKGESPTLTVEKLKNAASIVLRLPNRCELDIHWRPLSPTFVKSSIDGLNIDTLPLLGGTAGGLAQLIPGSSVKGVIRQQAERIVRTLTNKHEPAWWNENGRQRFLDQLNEDLPLIQEVFGSRSEAESTDARKNMLGLGALSISDCFSKQSALSEAWNDYYYADGHAPTAAKDWQDSFHVAIDRWTGGAADTALFQVLDPIVSKDNKEPWEPFRLEIDLDRIADIANASNENSIDAETVQIASIVLLLLVIRDLSQQRIPIGFGGNRGRGEIEIEKVELRFEGNQFGLKENEVTLPEADLSSLGEQLSAWESAWQNCIDQEATNNV